MQVFRLEDYTDDNYVMNCETFEEAQIFEKFLDEEGRCYRTGLKYGSCTPYIRYGKRCCYSFNEGSFADAEFYLHQFGRNIKILKFKDFDWHCFCYSVEDTDDCLCKIADDINDFIDGLI